MEGREIPWDEVSARAAALSPERRALFARKLRAAGEIPRRLVVDPVAIVGMGCRLPGGADDPEGLWRLLRGGHDAVTEVPPERWDARAWYDPDPGAPGRTSSRWGAFLREIDRFDAAFFGVSPREAARMDPKHRVLLEVTWEALDDAGLPGPSLAGSRTAVFVAAYQGDHARLALADPGAIDAYAGLGAQQCLAAGRISYLLDLRGPSLVVDTACSSSLVAVHLACRSLLAGECDRAIVGAVSLVLAPEECVAMAKLGMLAADGRCKTFDARADGFVRGEGCGVVVLERLSDALAAGRDIRALVRGTAVNQDGRTNGLTAPSGRAQEEVIRLALADAAASPAQIGYVETHGSGTRIGDPIEVEALRAVVGAPRPDRGACVLGAVKTNLGHLEAAAGMAGLLKAALALQRGEIPPNLHLEETNPDLPLAGSCFLLPRAPTPWPPGGGPRLAGLSSFGLSGTNAHLVLEEAPRPAPAPAPRPPGCAELLPISARSPGALRALAAGYRRLLDAPEGEPSRAEVQAICAAAALGRAHHEHRLALVARGRAELAERLDAFLKGEPRPGTSAGRAPVAGRPRLAFVFPGQGGQWPGMGRALLESEPAFRERFEACDRALRAAEGWSLRDALAGDPAWLDRVDRVQPLLFALQVSLAAQLRAFGIEPDAVIGHSMGEAAAAVVAGALDVEAGLRVVARRSRLLSRARGSGGMAAVALSAEQAAELVAGRPEALSIAAVNGPTATVIAGDAAALDAIVAELERRGVDARRIRVDVASHSAAVEELCPTIRAELADLQPRRAAMPMISTVTGAPVEGPELDAAYWARNLREPVRFWPALRTLVSDTPSVFLELGPHPTLLAPLREGLALLGLEARSPLLAAMRRGEDDRAGLLGAVGALYCFGFPVAWSALQPPGGPRAALPAYPWDRAALPAAPERRAPAARSLLGEHIALAEPPGAHLWHGALDAADLALFADHRVEDAIVLPGTATLDAALAATAELFGPGPRDLTDVVYERPAVLPDDGTCRFQMLVTEQGPGAAAFRLHQRRPGEPAWTLVARGGAAVAQPATAPLALDVAAIRARCGAVEPGAAFYARRAARGNAWGPGFQGIARLWRGDAEALAEIVAPAEVAGALPRHALHPALLDACGQAAVELAEDPAMPGPFVLAGVARVRLRGPLVPRLWSHLTVRRRDRDGVHADVRVADPDGRIVVEVDDLRLARLAARGPERRPEDALTVLQWQPAPRPAGAPTSRGGWLIVADRGGVGDRLAAIARADGRPCALVRPDVGAAHASLPGAAAPEPPWEIVYLAALDAPAGGAASAAALEAEVLRLAGLALEQLHGALDSGRSHRIWLITRGAQPVEPGPVAAAQAVLLGLGRTLEAERPEHLGGLVDLPPDAAAGEAAALIAAEIAGRSGPAEEVAYRRGERLAARLSTWDDERSAPEPLRLRPDASYLVTGGLGDLGLLVARRLVERGARHLVLLGRTPPGAAGAGDARAAAITALEALGARVRIAVADVGDERALRASLAAHDAAAWPAIRGVIHCAGVHRPAPLDQLAADDLLPDLRSKVLGAWLLDRLLADLDLFVLFSSAATQLGSPLLGGYAAANAFLDALAHDRRARGLPALSVGWGYWDGVGMAARRERAEGRRAAPRGVAPLAPDRCLDVLERLLAGAPPHVGVLGVDWSAWSAAYPEAAAAPRLALLAGRGAAPSPGEGPGGAALLVADPLAGAPEERRGRLELYLRARVAAALRRPAADLPLDEPLVRLGLDSLMAVELRSRLAAELAIAVSIVDVLRSPGVLALAELLAARAEPAGGWEEITL
ncbi:type I polyketide synthase [Sorangium sp. So ce394]|uniref:type I polyketide synthase n=1 Tax=Sorangium sp. So ce394 TaxID=3133310 RepID=UPI003F5C5FCB